MMCCFRFWQPGDSTTAGVGIAPKNVRELGWCAPLHPICALQVREHDSCNTSTTTATILTLA
eukprot:6288250-Prorocentrum_lima.AAC.1